MLRPNAIRPHFFIVGAPKAGTTALAEYLRRHPSLFVSRPKEPFFFCEDLAGLPRVHSLDAYLELFSLAGPEVKFAGEGSTVYLYSKVAIPKLREFDSAARIIVMLRNPIDLVHAFRNELIRSLDEDVMDFERAWELQAKRRDGISVPPLCREPALLQYREIGRLGEQVSRLLDVFPRSQIHFIQFDEFARSTARVYNEVLSFIGVVSDGRTEFPRINENRLPRYPNFTRWLHRPPHFLSTAAASFKRSTGLHEFAFLDGLRRSLSDRRPRRALAREMREHLAAEFCDDVALLSELVGRDLSGWVKIE